MNRGREGSDKQRGEDIDGVWWTNSYCNFFDTRAKQSREDGCYICTLQKLSEVLVPFGICDRLVMRMPFSLPHTPEQLSFLNEILIGPNSNYAFFLYSYKDCVERIVRVRRRIPSLAGV